MKLGSTTGHETRGDTVVLTVLGFVLAAVGIAGSAGSDPPPLVEVRPEAHKSGEVTYHYRIVNHRPSPLAEVMIGVVPSLDEPELRVTPIGWVPETNDCPTSMKAPQGWTACVGRQEESDRHFLVFAAKGDSAFLRPDAALTFSVTVSQPDSTYRTARFYALGTELPADEGRVMEVSRDD